MDKMLEEMLLLKLKNNYCHLCGTQRCDFSEDWRSGCKHWRQLLHDSLNPETHIPVLYYDLNIMSPEEINSIGEWLHNRYPRIIILPTTTSLVNLEKNAAINTLKETQRILEDIINADE